LPLGWVLLRWSRAIVTLTSKIVWVAWRGSCVCDEGLDEANHRETARPMRRAPRATVVRLHLRLCADPAVVFFYTAVLAVRHPPGHLCVYYINV